MGIFCDKKEANTKEVAVVKDIKREIKHIEYTFYPADNIKVDVCLMSNEDVIISKDFGGEWIGHRTDSYFKEDSRNGSIVSHFAIYVNGNKIFNENLELSGYRMFDSLDEMERMAMSRLDSAIKAQEKEIALSESETMSLNKGLESLKNIKKRLDNDQ